MKEIYDLSIKTANYFYIGEDSDAWNCFVEFINALSARLGTSSSVEEQRVLLTVVKDLETIELMKADNNALAIADFIFGDIADRLRRFVEVN